MKRISFFKKLRFFNYYKKILKESKIELERTLNIRVDRAFRLYTVLNVPEELVGDAFSLKKSDIDRISENYIREYSIEVSKFLNSKGLTELFKSYEISKVGKYSYLIIIGFSLFNTQKYYNTIYYKIMLPFAVISLIVATYFLLR